MAYKKYSRRNYKKRPTYKRRSYARKTRKMSPLKKMVRAEIARSAETKSQQTYVSGKIIESIATGSTWTASIFPITPGTGYTISQGAQNGQRVGNRITTKKATFRGTIVPNGYDSIFNTAMLPLQIRMVLFYDKRTPTQTPSPLNDMWQLNNGSVGLFNQLDDMWAPINSEFYTQVYSKVWKIGFAAWSSTAGGYQPITGGFMNNDFKANVNFSIDFTKMMPKTVVFEGNAVSPTSRGLWCAMIPCYANGGAIPNGSRTATMSYAIDYRYEDA